MSLLWITLSVAVGCLLWLAGANTLYNLLELVDALRPEKPDEKPVGRWLAWGAVAIVGFPLLMLLGIFRVMTVVIRVCSRPSHARRETPQ